MVTGFCISDKYRTEINGLGKFFDDLRVAPFDSDPTVEDTDGDGLLDVEDDEPSTFNQLKNYFIAYDRPGKELYEQAYWMMDWAYNNEDVEIFYLHTVDDFIECWNKKIPSRVNSIHLYLHGSKERETDVDYIDFWTPFLQFYGEEMSPCNSDFDILKEKYVETKIYLNACQGGTEDRNGNSVAKRLSEKIINDSTVEALNGGNVNYLSVFDYNISPYIKSSFDKKLEIPGFCFVSDLYINYNLIPRPQLNIGSWVEISAKYEGGVYTYDEEYHGNQWIL